MRKRPFYTHPQPDDPQWSNSFDLLFRGLELTTGGQRLHRYTEYQAALAASGQSEEPYDGYLQAFRHGMPPHGGFAIGLERWVARLTGAENIREARLFPRDLNRLTPSAVRRGRRTTVPAPGPRPAAARRTPPVVGQGARERSRIGYEWTHDRLENARTPHARLDVRRGRGDHPQGQRGRRHPRQADHRPGGADGAEGGPPGADPHGRQDPGPDQRGHPDRRGPGHRDRPRAASGRADPRREPGAHDHRGPPVLEESDPGAKANQRIHFFKNVSMLGGLLIAGMDTEGKPGLAWRAKHAATDVRREAKHIRKAAKREAKLAKKSI